MITVLEKHGEDDYSVWFSEIPENDPLWKELMEKILQHGKFSSWNTCRCNGRNPR